MTADQQLLLIRNFDIWSHITDDEYAELKLEHHFIVARKNEYIYFDSHFHNKLYFLKAGYIRIGYIDNDGKEVISEIIRKGEVFGQLTLERNNLNGEFAQAYKTDVSLCAFNIEDFEKLLYRKPRIALQFSRQVGQQLKKVENRLVNLLNRDVRTRLIQLLLILSEKETIQNNQCQFANFLTHEDFAHLIGSSRQTVTTCFGELEQSGLASINRNSIRLLDVKALQNLATVR